MNHAIRLCQLLLCSSLALLWTGCGEGGPKTYHLSGKLTQAGQPMTFPSGGGIVMYFVEVDEQDRPKENQYTANVKSDGSYEADVPAGKYLIDISWYEKYPSSGDKLNGAYNAGTSTLRKEVTQKEDGVNFDLK
jgi:hypothetical protein